jgi:hypothetical protein
MREDRLAACTAKVREALRCGAGRPGQYRWIRCSPDELPRLDLRRRGADPATASLFGAGRLRTRRHDRLVGYLRDPGAGLDVWGPDVGDGPHTADRRACEEASLRTQFVHCE